MVQASKGIQKMADPYHVCRKGENYDNVPFKEKMGELTDKLYKQIEESSRLDEAIKANLEELGYGE